MNRYKYYKIVIVIGLVSLLSGCMSGMFYKKTSDVQIKKVNQGDLKAAVSSVNSSGVLANMQIGSLQRMGKNYQDSNNSFIAAQNAIQQWTTSWKNSTTAKLASNTLSLLVNDNVHDYQPMGFEKSFIATFAALNHIDLNDLANARVAIKQMYETERAIQNYNEALYHAARQQSAKQRQESQLNNSVYMQIKKKYNFSDINSPAVLALRNSYQNAFGHYLAGFVFEALNEPSLARPGYVKAGQLNPHNRMIQQSINNIDNGVRPKPGYTDLLLVETVGHAPQIQSMEMVLPIFLGKNENDGACIHQVTLFYPKLLYDRDNKPIYNYKLDGITKTPSPMVDVNLMAARAIHDDMPHLILRNVVSAMRDLVISSVACHQSAKEGKQAQGGIIGIGGLLLGYVLNRIDERTWVMLPAKININRMQLKYGQHKIAMKINGKLHILHFKLDRPYQVLAFRVFGDQLYFEPQLSMETT